MHSNSRSEMTGSMNAYTVVSRMKASEVIGTGHI